MQIDLHCNIECDDPLSSQISMEFKSEPVNYFV